MLSSHDIGTDACVQLSQCQQQVKHSLQIVGCLSGLIISNYHLFVIQQGNCHTGTRWKAVITVAGYRGGGGGRGGGGYNDRGFSDRGFRGGQDFDRG